MGNYSLHMNLDRVEAWPVELRNSTGWSSRRSSWSSRWLLPSSFAYPVELRPCAKSLHAPHVHMLQNAPKDLFQRTKHAYVLVDSIPYYTYLVAVHLQAQLERAMAGEVRDQQPNPWRNHLDEPPLDEVQDRIPREGLGPELNRADGLHRGDLGDHQGGENQETVGDSDSRPELLQSRSPIRTYEGHQFEIKPRVIALVKQSQYHGLIEEDPLDHVDSFEELCSTTSANGVPGDYLRCRLFTFTLAGKALKWLKSLPSRSITTWMEFKKAFLGQFYTKQRTSLMRSKIVGFQQGPIEPYHEGLERFKEYIRDCPQHGFSEVNLWNTFYEGIRREHKLYLDIASNGNFMSKSIEEAKTLIDNLAVSDSKNQPSYEETIKAINARPGLVEFEELKSMIAKLLEREPEHRLSPRENNMQRTKVDEREVLYISKQEIQHPAETRLGAKEHGGELKALMYDFIGEQRRANKEINEKIHYVYHDLNNKFGSLESHIKELDLQIANIASTIKKPLGVLPGRTEANPKKEHIAAITLRSGTQLDEVELTVDFSARSS
ncbi:unnamed protein product [Microthlaspi erraticum]|uniref:Retrotransposon gag domain-containing protein n=1 Tax=Microthlaspi erraticum TaxID=1685480 RepID=A0A6D2J2N6_9BRAS|nr:unnamed protein product [Microthlaspi erraticum]